jgi:hypothetical protein
MTYCSTLAKPLLAKINAGKTLDEIGSELCGTTVKSPRKKAIRLIRELLGEEILIEHSATLIYDKKMATLGKKEKLMRNPLQKIETEAHIDIDIEPEPEQDDEGFPLTIIEAIRGLNIYFSIEEIKQAVATIEQEKVT